MRKKWKISVLCSPLLFVMGHVIWECIHFPTLFTHANKKKRRRKHPKEINNQINNKLKGLRPSLSKNTHFHGEFTCCLVWSLSLSSSVCPLLLYSFKQPNSTSSAPTSTSIIFSLSLGLRSSKFETFLFHTTKVCSSISITPQLLAFLQLSFHFYCILIHFIFSNCCSLAWLWLSFFSVYVKLVCVCIEFLIWRMSFTLPIGFFGY